MTFCKNAYCEYCKMWINSKFKAYYFEHHISTSNHQNNIKLRSYQKEEEPGVQNSIYSMKNLILHVLLEGKPISTIESPFFQNICPILPNRQKLTKAVKLFTDPFREFIKSFLQKIPNLFLCVDEWSDKLKRNFLGVTVHDVADSNLKKCLIYFKRINPAKVSGPFFTGYTIAID